VTIPVPQTGSVSITKIKIKFKIFMKLLKYYIIYKPFNMLSQFSTQSGKATLGQLASFEKDIYPVGRLDADSEGLLILTNDKQLNHRLLNPEFRHSRTYLVQVDSSITREALDKLCNGVTIIINRKPYRTIPAKAAEIKKEPDLPERVPPIRYRKTIPTSWVEITLNEGKNRQVRKMTAAVGFPTLRLVRIAIEGIRLDNMNPGDVRELTRNDVYSRIFGE
jgi:23S rRNA pseudouridine2457 synthase